MSTKIFSFFSGAGFLDLGFEDEGFDVAFVNEYHPPFLSAYQHSRSIMKHEIPRFGYHLGSITDLLGARIGSQLNEYMNECKREGASVGFIGGPPCPDFSVGGKNRGEHGDNGKLSASYVKLIINQRPNFFLFENVKGLWKTKKHRQFYDGLKRKLHDAGYNLSERLINSIEYGVAQDRERVILVGFLDYDTQDKLGADMFPWASSIVEERSKLFDLSWPETSPFEPDSFRPSPLGIQSELTVEHWFVRNNVEDHANGKHHFQPRAGLRRFQSVLEGDVSRKSYKRLHRWRYSPTAAYGNNEVHLHPYKLRRISVAEALAIQSLPKEFELPEYMSLSNMFKCVGNGVPYLAARGLARSLKRFMCPFEQTARP